MAEEIIYVTAYPYATQDGKIAVPKGLSAAEIKKYILNNWDDIKFTQPELDYGGTDFDLYNENGKKIEVD